MENHFGTYPSSGCRRRRNNFAMKCEGHGTAIPGYLPGTLHWRKSQNSNSSDVGRTFTSPSNHTYQHGIPRVTKETFCKLQGVEIVDKEVISENATRNIFGLVTPLDGWGGTQEAYNESINGSKCLIRDEEDEGAG